MLRACLFSFLLLIGSGVLPVAAQFVGKNYEVGSVDEFLSAIGPDRTIHLKPAALTISHTSLQKRQHVGRLGYAIFIQDVKNLRIAGPKAGASDLNLDELTLTFAKCRNIELRNLKLQRTGKTPGAVVRFVTSTNLLLRNCELSDGNALGIELKQVDRFEMRNVTVRNCRPGILTVDASANFVFENCRFENNGPQSGMRFNNAYGVRFENCVFASNKAAGDFFQLTASAKLALTGGEFRDNQFARWPPESASIVIKDVDGLRPAKK